MAAFVVFWAAVLVILFFALEMVFKALVSVLNALLSAVGRILKLGWKAAYVGGALYLLFFTINEIRNGGFWVLVACVALYFFVISLFVALLGGLGRLILNLAAMVFINVRDLITMALEGLAAGCHKVCIKMLSVIIKRLARY